MDAMMTMVSRAGGLTRICRIVDQMTITMVLFVMYARCPLPSPTIDRAGCLLIRSHTQDSGDGEHN